MESSYLTHFSSYLCLTELEIYNDTAFLVTTLQPLVVASANETVFMYNCWSAYLFLGFYEMPVQCPVLLLQDGGHEAPSCDAPWKPSGSDKWRAKLQFDIHFLGSKPQQYRPYRRHGELFCKEPFQKCIKSAERRCGCYGPQLRS